MPSTSIAVEVDGSGVLVRLPEWKMFVGPKKDLNGTVWPGCSDATALEQRERWTVEDAEFSGLVHRRTSFGIDPQGHPAERRGACRVVIAHGLLYGFFEPSTNEAGIWFRLGRGTSAQSASKNDICFGGDGWTVTGRGVIQVFTEMFQENRADTLREAVSNLAAALPQALYGRPLPADWDELAPGMWATPDRRHAALTNPSLPRAHRLKYLANSVNWLPAGQREVENNSLMGGDLRRPGDDLPAGWTNVPFVTSFSPGFSSDAATGAALAVAQHCFPQLAADGSLVLEQDETAVPAESARAAGVFEPSTDSKYWEFKMQPFGPDDHVVFTSARVVLAPAGPKAVNMQLRRAWIRDVFTFTQTDAALKKRMLGLMPAQAEQKREYVGFRIDTATYGPVALLVETSDAAAIVHRLRPSWGLATGITQSAESSVMGRGRLFETRTFSNPGYVGFGVPTSLLGGPREL